MPRYSLIIPFFNEEGNITPLVHQALGVFASLDGAAEFILVDDGSTDATPAELERLARAHPSCRVIRFPRNGGQAAALLEGLRQARGDLIFTMDGDGQNDPADFPRLLGLVSSGVADVACGIRTPRHDSALRRAMSRLANAVRGRFLGDGLHDAGCQLRVFRREVIGALHPSPLLQAFLPAMARAAGFRLAELPVRHRARARGESKYGLCTLWWQPMREMIRLRRLLRSQTKRG